MCDENPGLKKKADSKYCGCFVPRLAFIIDYMLSLLQINVVSFITSDFNNIFCHA